MFIYVAIEQSDKRVVEGFLGVFKQNVSTAISTISRILAGASSIAAANMQVSVSIRGRSAIDIPACHVMWQISLPLECPLWSRQCEYPIDVQSMAASDLPA